MRRLSGVGHHQAEVDTMSYNVLKQQAPALARRDTEPSSPGQLEVNVIFTDQRATVAAVRAATRLARDLTASIRVRAAIAVPFSLPLDRPQISIPFTEEVLSGLVSRFEQNSLDITAHLYLSRNRIETFLQILQPNSLVVIAGRKRPWPTPESRIAKRLQSEVIGLYSSPSAGEIQCANRIR
jgi:hypothetical protein